MYIDIHVSIYLSIYICLCIYTYIHIPMYLDSSIYLDIHTPMYLDTSKHAHSCVHRWMFYQCNRAWRKGALLQKESDMAIE